MLQTINDHLGKETRRGQWLDVLLLQVKLDIINIVSHLPLVTPNMTYRFLARHKGVGTVCCHS
jgi:hypothetical protein